VAGQTNNRSRLIFLGGLAAAGLIALVIVLATGGSDKKSSSAGLPSGCESVSAPAAKNVQLSQPPLKAPPAGTTATVDTSCGSFTIALDTAKAPKTSASFAYMAEQGAYDDTSFTRIAPGFVIQGGDPTETQAGNAGYTVTEAPPTDITYSEGTVAMAKSGSEPAGTSGSQFFVVIGAQGGSLPPDYALLGTVDSGMDVVQRIASIGTSTGTDGPPKSPVVIHKITVGG
jgi:peptidyl-prolyl cis-trans isomerase B (cyclophilin B)